MRLMKSFIMNFRIKSIIKMLISSAASFTYLGIFVAFLEYDNNCNIQNKNLLDRAIFFNSYIISFAISYITLFIVFLPFMLVIDKVRSNKNKRNDLEWIDWMGNILIPILPFVIPLGRYISDRVYNYIKFLGTLNTELFIALFWIIYVMIIYFSKLCHDLSNIKH